MSYHITPDRVLGATRFLLVAFGEIERDDVSGCMPLLTSGLLRRAKRLLGVMTESYAKRYWELPRKWKNNLRYAGLDPETLEVVDQTQWLWAWEQLRRGEYSVGLQMKRIALELEPPKQTDLASTSEREEPRTLVQPYASPGAAAAVPFWKT
jgi:hypothetical protein